MSDENFLTRWSRRKRETTAVDAPQQSAPAEPVAAPEAPVTTSEDQEIDLASLPSLESITGETDITAFLRKGIPQELRRAALRRAWEADPAIRDFIGLAENAWDFNDPNAMPGFGPLDYSEEQLAALVNRVVGGVRSAADQLAAAVPEQTDQAELAAAKGSPELVADPEPARAIASEQQPTGLAAVQPQEPDQATDDEPAARPRTHGSALPR
ncbi:MAG TPA: DUF3306 domain-containing protein [Bradyrhizobium sp.]|jgi:hypothetical protein|nr:DUF3306 domain-containing protein [Bradyrhizobium sp.]